MKKKKKKMASLSEELTQQQICNDFHEWTTNQLLSNSPVLVLMTILGQTLKIMKTTMPSAEYEAIMDTVNNSKDRIESFKKPTIN